MPASNLHSKYSGIATFCCFFTVSQILWELCQIPSMPRGPTKVQARTMRWLITNLPKITCVWGLKRTVWQHIPSLRMCCIDSWPNARPRTATKWSSGQRLWVVLVLHLQPFCGLWHMRVEGGGWWKRVCWPGVTGINARMRGRDWWSGDQLAG